MTKLVLGLAAAALLLPLCGCRTHVGNFTMISDRTVNLSQIDLNTLPAQKSTKGNDSAFIFLFIPFGEPTLSAAVANALDKHNGDLIINASVYATSWWFLVGQTGIEVRGDVVNTRNPKRVGTR